MEIVEVRLCERLIGEEELHNIFRKEDFEELADAHEMFARKFDEKVDKEIVDMIFERYGA